MRSIAAPFALFVLAVAVRLGYIFLLAPAQDASETERAAVTLAREGYFGNVFSADSGISAHLAPVYPLVLSVVYSLFGYDTPAGRMGQKLLAMMLTSLAIALQPALGRKLQFPPAAGWLAGLSMALSPLYWYEETSGSWEQPLAALAFIGFVWLYVTLHEEHWTNWRILIATGFLQGFIALLSPALLPAALLMFAAEWLSQRGFRRRVFLRGLVLMAISGMVIAPWTIRNYRIWGAFIPLRSNAGLEFLIGNNPKATGKSSITSWHDPASPFLKLHPFDNPAQIRHLKEVGEWAYMQECQRRAFAWIAKNPGRTVELTGRRFVLFWFAPPDIFEPGTSFIPLRTFLFSLTSVALLASLLALLRRRDPHALLLLAAFVGAPAIYMVTHVDMRYRYPLFGLSVLVSWAELVRLANHFRLSRTKAGSAEREATAEKVSIYTVRGKD